MTDHEHCECISALIASRDRLAGELAECQRQKSMLEQAVKLSDPMRNAPDWQTRAEGAERELSECRARNADLSLTNEVAVNRADSAERQLTQERARVEGLKAALTGVLDNHHASGVPRCYCPACDAAYAALADTQEGASRG